MATTEPPADSAKRGLRAVLISTAVAGVLGYAIQLLAPALLTSDAAYVAFSVFWSTIYLGVSAMSGVQQEVSRAARPISQPTGSTTLRTFLLCSALVVALAAVVLALIVGPTLPGVPVGAIAAALVVGLVGYLVAAILSGVLYGLALWRAVAVAAILDAAIRAILVLGGFAAGLPVVAIVFLVAVPFGSAALSTWALFRRDIVGRFRLDVDLRTLVVHAGTTVGAATASGLMISGLPMLIGATSAGMSAASLGALLLTITVTRAPIVVPIIALQSFLIAAVFRDRAGIGVARLLKLLGALLAVFTVLSALAALIGPPIIGFISAGRFTVAPVVAAFVVLSAGLVGAMCVTSPALIASRRHTGNIVGWAVAALLTIVLLVGGTGDVAVILALTVPPAVGLVIHVASLARAVPSRRTEADTTAL